MENTNENKTESTVVAEVTATTQNKVVTEIDAPKIEEKLNFEISKNQNIIEYSPNTFKYLKTICDIIQRNDGGILIIDYGYLNSKMSET